jgi:hypothetical protein
VPRYARGETILLSGAARDGLDGMSESRRALVLHLAGGGEPIWIAVPADSADDLSNQLPKLLIADAPQAIACADGSSVVVNFNHVAAALITTMPSLGSVYGNKR